MKKPKKAIPEIKTIEIEDITIKCPHCKTYLRGRIERSVLRFKCYQCENPIDINWDQPFKEI